MLAEFLSRQKRYGDAVEEFKAAYKLLAEHPQARERCLINRRADVAERLVATFAAWGDLKKAAEWREKIPTRMAPIPRAK